MTSDKRYVWFDGVIRGNGLEAQCRVRALEVRLRGSNAAAYTEYRIETVSRELPDGLYDVTVNGETENVRCRGGNWLAP